jgi:purine-binding chemotaxis protein CheW
MTATATKTVSNQAGSAPTRANQSKFLTFRLGGEDYGIEILRVREIIGMLDITPLPHAPAHIKGVVNLRGRIIPVVDLRTQFGMPGVEQTPQTCIVFVEVSTPDGGERFPIGTIVDSVNEVLSIPADAIEAAPQFGCSVRTDFILGMGKIKDRVFILLDIDHAMAANELAALSAAGRSADPTAKPAAA